MKRFLVALMVAAVAAIGFGGVTVFANNGDGAGTAFKATYPSPSIDGGTATWTCSGAHVVNKGSFKDSETCIVSVDVAGFANGTYSGSPAGFLAGSPFGAGTEWASDFTGENGAVATSWTIVETDNGDGTFTLDILAFYSS
jgi:hypothetical protein